MLGIARNAVDRAHLLALRLVEVAHALGAAPSVDHVDLGAHRDRGVRALGLANVTVGALIGDLGRHQVWPRPILASMRSAVRGWTKAEMSPPSTAISRTIVAERKRYLSEGVRKSVSTPGARRRFMPASWNSYSKSDTARSPRRITPASCSRTNSESRPPKPCTATFL